MKHAMIKNPGHEASEAVLLERAERELAFLQLRRRRLLARRLSDAHWAILLALYVAHAQCREVLTKDLEEASGLPLTTLLRHLDLLQEHGLIVRMVGAHDRRATCVEASNKGRARIASILREAPRAMPTART